MSNRQTADQTPDVVRPNELRFVDLCAGLGGFHLGLTRAAKVAEAHEPRTPGRWTFRCVLAADIEERLRTVYPQNFPDIVADYRTLYPPAKCAKTPGLSDLYDETGELVRIHGNLADLVNVETQSLRCWPGTLEAIVPAHDLLCAGFPCQPFSKSGAQRGFADLEENMRGTVFSMLAVIIKERRPRFVFLENVGNFEHHDNGNTWDTVRSALAELGYSVRATTSVRGKGNGIGLLSPHQLGLPQHRERFFIVAQLEEEVGAFEPRRYPFPLSYRSMPDPVAAYDDIMAKSERRLRAIVGETAASTEELHGASLSPDRVACVEHWREFLSRIDSHRRTHPESPLCRLPSFPIWGYELDPWNHYPADENPASWILWPAKLAAFRSAAVARARDQFGDYPPGGGQAHLDVIGEKRQNLDAWTNSWPTYARARDEWPDWKRRFIQLNREWAEILWNNLDKAWLRLWLDKLYSMPPSHQKLEWNCQGEDVDLWRHILQFRPSGLRVKRFRHIPALVAMTLTQIPVVPAQTGGGTPSRHLLAQEALALQGFPRRWGVPQGRVATFTALGNAVHVDLVAAIALSWLFETGGVYDTGGNAIHPTTAPVGVPHAVNGLLAEAP